MRHCTFAQVFILQPNLPPTRTKPRAVMLGWFAVPLTLSLKLSVDGSGCTPLSEACAGGLIRNANNGNWITSFSCRIGGTISDLAAKICALQHGLRILMQRNITMVEIELDASNVIQLITTATRNSHLFNIILDCRSLLQQLRDPPLRHVMREGNKFADLLAQDVRSHLFSFFSVSSISFMCIIKVPIVGGHEGY